MNPSSSSGKKIIRLLKKLCVKKCTKYMAEMKKIHGNLWHLLVEDTIDSLTLTKATKFSKLFLSIRLQLITRLPDFYVLIYSETLSWLGPLEVFIYLAVSGC